MGRRIGICSAAVNLAAVLGFAASMALGSNWGSYFSSMFIALSYVAMACAWARFAGVGRELAGRVAEAFAAMYAVLVLRVYFAQLTTVRFGGLTRQAADLLDFQRGNLMFYDDLLGYALMALSTFFAGLTVEGRGAARWLKGLLMGHGAFFLSCMALPLMGALRGGGAPQAGVLALEAWCAYFCPIDVLAIAYFRGRG